MAIAIANSLAIAYSGSGATSYTRSFAISGSDRYLLVGVLDVAGDTVTGVTYGGVSMTQLGKTNAATSRYIYLYGLANPTTGTNDIVASRSSGTSVFGYGAVNLSGATQTTSPVDASATQNGTGTTVSVDLTTVADNTAVIVMSSTLNGGLAVSTNLTEVCADAAFDVSLIGRSTTFPKTPAGVQTYGVTSGSSDNKGIVAVSISPVAAATSHIKSADGILLANIKSMDGITIAHVKSASSVTN